MTTNERTAFVVRRAFHILLCRLDKRKRNWNAESTRIIFTLNATGTVTLSAPDPDIQFQLNKNPNMESDGEDGRIIAISQT